MIGWRPLIITVLIVVVGLTACIVKTNRRAHPVYVEQKREKHKKHHDNGHHYGDDKHDHH